MPDAIMYQVTKDDMDEFWRVINRATHDELNSGVNLYQKAMQIVVNRAIARAFREHGEKQLGALPLARIVD